LTEKVFLDITQGAFYKTVANRTCATPKIKAGKRLGGRALAYSFFKSAQDC